MYIFRRNRPHCCVSFVMFSVKESTELLKNYFYPAFLNTTRASFKQNNPSSSCLPVCQSLPTENWYILYLFAKIIKFLAAKHITSYFWARSWQFIPFISSSERCYNTFLIVTAISVKEPWLLNGIYDYYLSSNSVRSMEILCNVKEPHNVFLFDK